MRWIKVERTDGEWEWINSHLVQRIRFREGVARLVFRALPGGMDEIEVKGTPDELAGLLADFDAIAVGHVPPRIRPRGKGRTKAGAAPPKSPQKA